MGSTGSRGSTVQPKTLDYRVLDNPPAAGMTIHDLTGGSDDERKAMNDDDDDELDPREYAKKMDRIRQSMELGGAAVSTRFTRT